MSSFESSKMLDFDFDDLIEGTNTAYRYSNGAESVAALHPVDSRALSDNIFIDDSFALTSCTGPEAFPADDLNLSVSSTIPMASYSVSDPPATSSNHPPDGPLPTIDSAPVEHFENVQVFSGLSSATVQDLYSTTTQAPIINPPFLPVI